MGTKIYIAGPLSHIKEIKSQKPKRILESFFGLKSGNKRDFMNFIFNEIGNENFLLDSGAFSFMNSGKKVVWDEYITKYIKFINKYDVKYFFELDIDSIVGYENVLKIRKRIENETSKKCIPVWHKSRGLQEWEKMCESYDFVAIGGLAIKHIKKNEYKYLNELIKIAHKKKCKVHGLGFTPMDILQYKFDTSDSTSWTMAARAGNIYKFENNRIKTLKRPVEFQNLKIDYKKAMEHSLKEWNKFINYVERN